MSDRVGFLFGGPILRRELTRATRGTVPTLLRYAFIGALGFEFFVLSGSRTPSVPSSYPAVTRGWNLPPILSASEIIELHRQESIALTKDAERYISFLLHQQLLLLLLFTPVATAGAIVYEKERDTLQALFGTELRSREIVVGKVLGRLIALAFATAAVLPALAFATALASFPVWRVVLELIQAAVLAYALASACLLVSLWTRRITDAIVGCYATMIVTFLLGQVALRAASVPDALDPLAILNQLLNVNGEFRPLAFLSHLAFWTAAGTLCLAVAAARVRPVSSVQMEKRAPRWLWAFRPPIGNDPVRWREQYVLGLAPLAVLRMVPRWMGWLGVLSFSTILACNRLNPALRSEVYDSLRKADFESAFALLKGTLRYRVSDDLNLMGMVLLLLGAIAVGVRCVGCIAEEKRRKTWEDLILTPLTMAEITTGKYLGILRASVLPGAVYAVPMFALSTLGGWEGVSQAASWMAVRCILIPLAGGFGMMLSDGLQGVPADEQSGDSDESEDPVRSGPSTAIRMKPPGDA